MSEQQQEVTNAILGVKLDHLTALVQKHLLDDTQRFDALSQAMNGAGEDPGIRTRIDRLEQNGQIIKWTATILGGSVLAQIGHWLTGGGKH